MPLGEYKDFDECVRKNKDKNDPKAYCGRIKSAVEEDQALKNQIQIKEQVLDIQEAEFNEDGGRMMATIRILKAGLSKNNRNYRPEALRKAAETGFFDGTRMFINHSKSPPIHRKFDEMVSAVESTEYDEADQSLKGHIEFFDRPFYEKAKAAKKYIGTSIDALVLGNRVQQPGRRVMEDIYGFHQARSVDWVLYPAAGGEILAFESEGDKVPPEIAWEDITEEDIKTNLPTLWAKWHPETSGQAPSGSGTPHKAQEAEGGQVILTQEQVAEIARNAITEYQKEVEETEKKQETAAALVREAFSKSGLPEVTRARVMASFEGVTEFVESEVNAAITAAKEELKELKVGPQIKGEGTTKDSGGNSGVKTSPIRVHESVRSAFQGPGFQPPKTADSDASKKEG